MIGRVALLAIALAHAVSDGVAAQSAVRVAASVSPDTVAVGQPVTLELRVTAPRGALVVFPEAVDSTASIEPLDPVVVTPPDGDEAPYIATYRLLAWRPGTATIPLGAINVDVGSGLRPVDVPTTRFVVSTVLPADSALRVPKESRPIIAAPRNLLPLYLGALALAALTALIVWLARRRRRGHALPRDPHAEAQRAFARLAALDLIGAGEPARHIASAVDIVREYLAARDGRASRGLTTDELIAVLAEDPDVPVRRVESFLRSCDVIRFSPASADATMAESLASEAEAIVRETHRVSRPQDESRPSARQRRAAEVA